MSGKPLITAERLKKTYGKMTAVDEISFSILEGECFGFLGPNGAGKTTTMKMLYGASPRTSGELRVFGLDPRTDNRTIKSRVGVVPQEENLDPDLSVLDNLVVFGRYFDLSRATSVERGLKLLEYMHLLDRKDEKIEHLSGGMKRRLLIARAMINEAKVLILDEPTVALDPQARHLVWQKLKKLKGSGVSLILTTHYMEEAERLCDRLVVMDHGRILSSGSPAELVEKHVGKEVLELHVGEERVDAMVKKMSRFRLTHEISGGQVFFYAGKNDDLRECYPLIEGENFFHRKASLEDVFLKLAGHDLRD